MDVDTRGTADRDTRHAFPATVRAALLARRVAAGHWEGHLSSSALATATAVTALAVAARGDAARDAGDPLVAHGLQWLVAHGNADGGWGDTPDSVSNISTTALVWAALAFGRGAGVEAAAARAEAWIGRAARSARPEALAAALAERYGRDRTFSVPILTMCAIAGRLGDAEDAWRLIPQLPFELAVLPRRFFGAMRLPVVSYALPALISMGLARHRRGPGLSIVGRVRERAGPRVLRVLQGLQPDGGGFLEAVPLTSFVAMSLVAAGEPGHPVVRNGLDFLRRSVRPDGSWAIDSNLATWVSTLAINALGSGTGGGLREMADAERRQVLDWLLAQQWRVEHPYTGAAPGGWAWTDLPGGVPDADDTAGALVALAHLSGLPSASSAPRENPGHGEPRVREAAALGVRWLLDLQNRDGGIPTFCRGWGGLPFDRSASDLTAHALRAWTAWIDLPDPALRHRIPAAISRGMRFLSSSQRADGAFVPLWFGNQAEPREENPVFGTGRVLAGLAAAARALDPRAAARRFERAGLADPRALAAGGDPMIARAVRWLLTAQHADGGWGAGPSIAASIEETAVAVSGLAALADRPHMRASLREPLRRGAAWLEDATDGGGRFPASPLGLYFARLWYAEDLYPLILTAGALSSLGD